MKVLLLVLAFVLGILASTVLQGEEIAIKMLKTNNEHRAAQGLGPQQLDPELAKLAQSWSEHMAVTGRYNHSGYPYAEIIFAGPTTVEDAFGGWLNSRAHASIMLGGSTSCGFGHAVGSNGTHYWTGIYSGGDYTPTHRRRLFRRRRWR